MNGQFSGGARASVRLGQIFSVMSRIVNKKAERAKTFPKEVTSSHSDTRNLNETDWIYVHRSAIYESGLDT